VRYPKIPRLIICNLFIILNVSQANQEIIKSLRNEKGKKFLDHMRRGKE